MSDVESRNRTSHGFLLSTTTDNATHTVVCARVARIALVPCMLHPAPQQACTDRHSESVGEAKLSTVDRRAGAQRRRHGRVQRARRANGVDRRGRDGQRRGRQDSRSARRAADRRQQTAAGATEGHGAAATAGDEAADDSGSGNGRRARGPDGRAGPRCTASGGFERQIHSCRQPTTAHLGHRAWSWRRQTVHIKGRQRAVRQSVPDAERRCRRGVPRRGVRSAHRMATSRECAGVRDPAGTRGPAAAHYAEGRHGVLSGHRAAANAHSHDRGLRATPRDACSSETKV